MSISKHLFKFQTLFLASIPASVIAVASTSAQAAGLSFSGMYVFGDSLSDTGNTFAVTEPLTQPPLDLLSFPIPPAEIPTPSGPLEIGYYNGRFSNGEIWIDFLADKLALPGQPVSFAFTGATTGTQNTSIPGLLPGVTQTIQSFTSNFPNADPDALYVIWAGANDYLGGIPNLDPLDPVGQPVQNIVNAITDLAGVRAKNILVANLPDIGRAPLVTEQGESALVSSLVGLHNTRLAEALAVLEPSLSGSGVNLIPLDVFSFVNAAYSNPADFGFENVTDACLYPSPILYIPPPSLPTRCANPDQYLYWDSLHPSSRSHEFIADLAYQTIKAEAIPEPTTALGLAAAFFGGAGYRKRQRRRASTSLLTQPSEKA
ncbi:MAG TPA: SGNH/GDSL hydrolase family protein [Leptolyngbyaceae cyanobacterium M33_DOE_097]|uniref:PEP-CTERM sorting domain-containing protein n=1 Tax=Oscillatoriales cyanobacterium SpSt-418 TaxID=2282169 RepID=A0A7C3KEW5_9CYAN|nr:SGNH/GDSL hydrolase family protein [Leptolyngbyaceae cyanobacterium M33_DOE_097]